MLRMNTSLLYGSLLNTFNTHIDVSYSIPAGLSGTKVTTAFHASSAASAQHFPSQTKILMRGMRRQNAIVYIDPTHIRREEV
jgi:hypothetical protein